MKTPSYGIDQNKDDVFMDKYWGRVPKFIHRIPEQNICEANSDYIYLINLVIDGNIDKNNISADLYREILSFIDKMCNPCIMNDEDAALMRAYDGLEACPEQRCELSCDDILCCNEILSCECESVCDDV